MKGIGALSVHATNMSLLWLQNCLPLSIKNKKNKIKRKSSSSFSEEGGKMILEGKST